MKQDDTYFATPARASATNIEQDSIKLGKIKYIKELLDALPDITAILNEDRQIVYCNESLLGLLSLQDQKEILGKRPGEAVNCKHSCEMPAGCGTAESCQYCGAVNAIIESQTKNKKITKECRITTVTNSNEKHLDLRITATPFIYIDKPFTIFSIEDISDEKRRRILERIFFHDVINTAGGLQGFIGFLKIADDEDELNEYIDTADRLSHDLVDEIQAQRMLAAAEDGELVSALTQIQAQDFLKKVADNMRYHEVANGKTIILDPRTLNTGIKTDSTILKRVIINMLKNALEASKEGTTVTIGSTDVNDQTIFWVRNPGMMPREVQLQVFKRSFSTKGSNRGLGTYSIKMLTERYLRGTVYFETSEESGTIFSAKIPRQPKSS